MGGFSRRVDPTITTPANLVGQLGGYSESAAPMGSKARKIYFKDILQKWGSGFIRWIGRRKHDIRRLDAESGRLMMFRKGDPAGIRLDLVGKLHSMSAVHPKTGVEASAPQAVASAEKPAEVTSAAATKAGETASSPPPHEVLLRRILDRSTQSPLNESVRAADIIDDFKQLGDAAIVQNLDSSLIKQLRQQLTLQLVEIKLPESHRVFFPPGTSLSRLGIDYFEDIDIPIQEREERLLAMGGSLSPELSPEEASASEVAGEDSEIAMARRLVERELRLAQGVRNLQTTYGHGTDSSIPTAALRPVEFIADLSDRLASLLDENKRVPAELVERLFDQARLMGSRADAATKERVLLPADALWSVQYLISSLNDPGYDPVSERHSALKGAETPEQASIERLEGFATYLDGLIGSDGYLDDARLNLVKAFAVNDQEKAYAEARHELQKGMRSLSRLLGAREGSGGKAQTNLSLLLAGSRLKFDGELLKLLKNNKTFAKNMPEVNLLLANVMLLQWKAEKLRHGQSPDLEIEANSEGLQILFENDLKELGFGEKEVAELSRKDGSPESIAQAQALVTCVTQLASLGLSRTGDVKAISKVVDDARAKLLSNRDLSALTGNAARAEAIAMLVDRDAAGRRDRLQALPRPDTLAKSALDYDLAASRISENYDRLSALAAQQDQATQSLQAYNQSPSVNPIRSDHATTRQFASEVAVLRIQQAELQAMQSWLNDLEGHADSSANDIAECRRLIPDLEHEIQGGLEKLQRLSGTPLHAMVFPSDRNLSASELLARLDSPIGGGQDEGPTLGEIVDAINTLSSAPSQEKLTREQLREDVRLQTRLLDGRKTDLTRAQQQDLRMVLVGAAARCFMESRQAELPAGDETPFPLWNHRARFTELLAESGLDIHAFAPEIEDMLLREINAPALEKWLAESGKLTPPPNAEPSQFQDATRAVIAGAIPSMKDGDRLFLKSNGAVELGLNGIPLGVPGVKIDAAASGGRRNIMVIQRKPKSLVVAIRAGKTGGLRLGVGATLYDAPVVKAKASAKAQINMSKVAGYSIEIPLEDNKAQDFIHRLMGNQPIDGKDLYRLAKDIKALTKSEIKASLDVSAGVNISPTSKDAVVGFSVGGNFGAGASKAWMKATQTNSKLETFKVAKSISLQATASLGVSVKGPGALGTLSGQVLGNDSPYSSTFASSPVQLAGVQLTESRTYEAELSVQRLANDGSLVKAEFEFLMPLGLGIDRAGLESTNAILKAQLATLTAEQGKQLDALLQKVDAQDGYALIIPSQISPERVKDLNTLFARERAQAEANRVLGRDVAEAQLKQAAENHQQRLEKLESEAKDFKLQRFILVKGDSMIRNQAVNAGIVRVAWQKQAGVGTTVEVLELSAPPVSSNPVVPIPDPVDAELETNDDDFQTAHGSVLEDQDWETSTDYQSFRGSVQELRASIKESESEKATGPASKIKNTAPIQQMAPMPITAEGYLAKIKNDNKKLHEYLQKAVQQPPAQTSVQAKAPQIDIPAFKAQGDQTVITSQNMGDLQQIPALKDYLSPQGSRYQETLQTLNVFRSNEGSPSLTNPAQYYVGKTVAEAATLLQAVIDVVQPSNEQPVLNPLQALASIGRSAVSIQDNGQCFYLTVASAQGRNAVLGTGEDVRNNAKSTRQALLNGFVALDEAGMKFVTGVSDVGKLPVSLNKVFNTLTTGLDGNSVGSNGWGGPEEARLAAIVYNRPVVSIRSDKIVISYPNKTEETCQPGQLQQKLAQIQSKNPMIHILQNNHWQNTIPQ